MSKLIADVTVEDFDIVCGGDDDALYVKADYFPAPGGGFTGWYVSVLIDSDTAHFVDTAVEDDGPYDSRGEALIAGMNFVHQWCYDNLGGACVCEDSDGNPTQGPSPYSSEPPKRAKKTQLFDFFTKRKSEMSGLSEMETYYSVVIPWSPNPTRWHPTEKAGPFNPLVRGAFKTRKEARLWAQNNLGGQPYQIRAYTAPSQPRRNMKPPFDFFRRRKR